MKLRQFSKHIIATTLIGICSLSHANSDFQIAVIQKFKTDKASFAQFLFFGKLHCLDRYIGPPGNLTAAYGIAFNYLYPLPRIFKQESLEAVFTEIEKLSLNTKHYRPQINIPFIDPIEVCRKIYTSDTRTRAGYSALVSNVESLHQPDDVDIEINMQDYLNGFFVRAPK